MEENSINLDDYRSKHYVHRSNWLRAAVLGANDGILSTASLAIGVASASETRATIVLAATAGLVAGALSMAAGEYVSVSSQTDLEKADIERERIELKEAPEMELKVLAKIYEERGLTNETAFKVARELSNRNALEAHVRDELGISEITKTNPIQASLASGGAFSVGGFLPVLVCLLFPVDSLIYFLYASAIFFLAVLGSLSAKAGGASQWKAILRITFWGTLAMGVSAFVGHLFGVNV